ncbi:MULTISPECIES: DNA-directed RNA polymerase subunit delta [Bacillaceae]|uniref:Probable DNA-directed RNA polymerase subunit delta n=1 Tax=Bacillus mesophilum TaxID=1071718 RepID=A0A7V7RLB2_9BACI|nr:MULTISPECIES: DNA-directed RNA polymerase subunit delta [Bacillaceae]KAB2332484.1 DNA-directed RNA polymerase subunit delta [Bacillus mesophilum]
MALQGFTKEDLQEMSLIEIAYEILKGKKEPAAFNDIMNEVKDLLEMTDEQVRAKISQFYTDMNIDGRFIGLGDNRWGLRTWYPVDQYEEEVVTVIKPKKKKAKKTADDDLELEDYDELDEEEIDYDDIEDYDDIDEDDDEDDDLLDDDLDEFEEEDDDLIEDIDEEDDEDDLDEDLDEDEDEEDL